MFTNLEQIFCDVDDFCKIFIKELQNQQDPQKDNEVSREIFTLLESEIKIHQSIQCCS